MSEIKSKWYNNLLQQQDWWTGWPVVLVLLSSLLLLLGVDMPGWMAQPKAWEWTDFWNAPATDKLLAIPHRTNDGDGLGGLAALLVTYLVFAAIFSLSAWFLRHDIKKSLFGFTLVFLVGWGSWILSHEVHLRAVQAGQSATLPQFYGDDLFCISRIEICDQQINAALQTSGTKLHPSRTQAAAAVESAPDVMRLSWSLQLGNGTAYLLALLAGLVLGRYAKRVSAWLDETNQADWFIKSGIVCFGATLGLMALSVSRHPANLLLTSAISAGVVFLLLWPALYVMTRRLFGLARGEAATLCSGIAAGGITTVLLTASSVRIRPLFPVLLAVWIVIYAALELLGLPEFFAAMSGRQPIVGGAALGLTLKNDILARAAASTLDQMLVSHHYRATGVRWGTGMISAAGDLVRYWSVVFAALWALLLAHLWSRYAVADEIETAPDAVVTVQGVSGYLIGFVLLWGFFSVMALRQPDGMILAGAAMIGGPLREMLFILGFVAVGAGLAPGQLRDLGKPLWLYTIGLLVFVPPIALLVAYIFHNGLFPPVAGH
ncbi:MAG: hypothetical protein OEY07_06715 [Gammaproteobacteria bacterium]|nr:hypothetical protein [Gammaproteobacteria bacterium]